MIFFSLCLAHFEVWHFSFFDPLFHILACIFIKFFAVNFSLLLPFILFALLIKLGIKRLLLMYIFLTFGYDQ